ncbi:TetR/AcrR family transcriptional regulator [Nocardiopsis valliformis]|uniref:TetR/AcrR family transcriptional regulator n=1 Tax=Nocardiopsis valliformis TaxID=239974 RepID=UPI00034DB136
MAGVSHRTVSQEAGLPTSATTDYFTGLGDLLTAALTRVMDEDSERMRRLSGGGDRRRDLAELLARVAAEPGRLLAEYELFLLAVRRPHLRESTDAWLAAVGAFARCYTDDPVRARGDRGDRRRPAPHPAGGDQAERRRVRGHSHRRPSRSSCP